MRDRGSFPRSTGGSGPRCGAQRTPEACCVAAPPVRGERADQREQVNDEVVDVVRTDTVAEIAAVPASNAPLHTMLQWLFTLVRNKRITTEHLDTLRNDADGAEIATAALTHTATDFTKDEYS